MLAGDFLQGYLCQVLGRPVISAFKGCIGPPLRTARWGGWLASRTARGLPLNFLVHPGFDPIFALLYELVPVQFPSSIGELRPVFGGLIQTIQGGRLER